MCTFNKRKSYPRYIRPQLNTEQSGAGCSLHFPWIWGYCNKWCLIMIHFWKLFLSPLCIVLVLFSWDQTNSSKSFRLLKLSRITFQRLSSLLFVNQIPLRLLEWDLTRINKSNQYLLSSSSSTTPLFLSSSMVTLLLLVTAHSGSSGRAPPPVLWMMSTCDADS